jgi:hypothetical protein
MSTGGAPAEGEDRKFSAAGIPRMPAVQSTKAEGMQSVVYDAKSDVGIAYQWESREKGGAYFFAYRRSWVGGQKMATERFPATRDGWCKVWCKFSSLYPEEARRAGREIAAQQARADRQSSSAVVRSELEDDTIAFMGGIVFLGGYFPFREMEGESYCDLRFLSGGLGVFPAGDARSVGNFPYSDFTAVQIGGPGLVTSVSGLVAPAQTIVGAAIGLAQPGVNSNIKDAERGVINAVLNRIGTRTKIKTVVYVQTRNSELFFLNTEVEPDQLRIDLSHALGRIREVLSSASPSLRSDNAGDTASVIAQLKHLADLLDRGVITRDEFNQLKSELLNSGS